MACAYFSGDVLDKLQQSRNEISNIRKNLCALKFQHKKDLEMIEEKIKYGKSVSKIKSEKSKSDSEMTLKPIGYIRSCYKHKNGTPRQGSIAFDSRATLSISKATFNNPEHSLEGLSEFSHLWVMFIFDKNGSNSTHSKVRPPRLNGEKLGVFATRSPHRPNPIGLTLAKLDKIKDGIIHLSGIDMINGTPIIDLKPYIPSYDCPVATSVLPAVTNSASQLNKMPVTEQMNNVPSVIPELKEIPPVTPQMNEGISIIPEVDIVPDTNIVPTDPPLCQIRSASEADGVVVTERICVPEINTFSEGPHHPEVFRKNKQENLTNGNDIPNINEVSLEPSQVECKNTDLKHVHTATWIDDPPIKRIRVIFNQRALKEIEKFSLFAPDIHYRTNFIHNGKDLLSTISNILSEEPRSIYRRKKCSDRLYFFSVDTVHVTSWFVEDEAEVLRVCPISSMSSN